ncbi:MAG: hypothetical protein UY42_C0001G0033 [Parcubacteria group bacterium GW2011_GWA2_49_16]|nr:MAG: hypothetical protein UY42_C0001G0033 [Parcubacteria group bacterium GW2011_GWA2_49_16]
MKKVLTKDFFERPTLSVAREMLGKYLVRRVRGREVVAMITEVEAYDGFRDKASHAHRGETRRNAVMFGNAGVWYVYLVYGMHEMVNIVTGGKGYPAAVLIRGVEGVLGPGRVTKHFHISRPLDGKVAEEQNGLWVEDRGVRIHAKEIRRLPRVGVAYAGAWAEKKYRFVYLSSKRFKTKRTGGRPVRGSYH